MILDLLVHYQRYVNLHPAFAQAFECLTNNIASMPPGRHTIDGERLYLLIDSKDGRGRDGARLESHRRYIDIQLTIDGAEEIGWTPRADCRMPSGSFDEQKDIEFFDDRPETWMQVTPGRFAIFFPEDAHAPLAGVGRLRKGIVKVAVQV
jgi:YhcH/YjgK/YiaL family protein